MTFRMKTWVVGVVGHPDTSVIAATQSAARMEAFRRYRNAYDAATLKDFLKVCAYVRLDDRDPPTGFGNQIFIQTDPTGPARKGHYIGKRGNHILFVYDDETQILSAHQNDVMRPWEPYGGNRSVPF